MYKFLRLFNGTRAFQYLVVLTVAVLITSMLQINAQERDSLSALRGRDETAVDESIHGWWTASMKYDDARISWWREAKFGCFIHWMENSFGPGSRVRRQTEIHHCVSRESWYIYSSCRRTGSNGNGATHSERKRTNYSNCGVR